MRATIGRALTLALSALAFRALPVRAQDVADSTMAPVADSAVTQDAAGAAVARMYLAYVTDAFYETPGGAGLLPTAIAEAEVARREAELAAGELYDLGAMKRHALAVIHAVDPTLATSGPGLGYGVRRAAQGIADQIELAVAAPDASYNLRTHARYVIGAARSVVARADRVTGLASRVESENSVTSAASTVSALAAEASALFFGLDTDGDGRVGWADPEGGLRQIQQHVTLLMRGEARTSGGVEP